MLSTEMKKRALVLLSGGIDSAVLLWWVRKQRWEYSTLSFHFPGRRKGEIRATGRLRKLSGCRQNFDVTLPFVDPPQADRSCYIPQRNLMYYGIAASMAEKIGADRILGGHIRHDGQVFQDATRRYFKRLEGVVQMGKNSRSVRLLFPLIELSKQEIVRLGATLRLPFELTWSCSRDGKRHCRRCGSCRERREGFERAGLKDPLHAE